MENETYIVLAADPVEKKWSVLFQTTDPDKAMDALLELDEGEDPSLRACFLANKATVHDVSRHKEP